MFTECKKMSGSLLRATFLRICSPDEEIDWSRINEHAFQKFSLVFTDLRERMNGLTSAKIKTQHFLHESLWTFGPPPIFEGTGRMSTRFHSFVSFLVSHLAVRDLQNRNIEQFSNE